MFLSPIYHQLKHVMVTNVEGLTVVEPIPEIVEAIFYEVFGGAKVEPRVDWYIRSAPEAIVIALCAKPR